MKIKSTKWRFFFMLFNNRSKKNLSGEKLRFVDYWTPYHLLVNTNEKRIEIRKRNWFYFGVNKKVYNYGQIRNIFIDEHLITADLFIKVYAGSVSCYWISKKDANAIKNFILNAPSKVADYGVVDDT